VKELDVLLEALRHRKLIHEPVPLSRRDPSARRCSTGYCRHQARLGDVFADAERLPLRVAGPETLAAELLLVLCRHLVVGNGNAPPTAAILSVESHDRVCGGAGAAEEIDD